MSQDQWTPKVGETVKYVSKSIMSGALANVQAMAVTKVTPAGFVYIDRRRGSKFKRGGLNAHFHEAGKHTGSMYSTWIEPVSAEEASKLPRSDIEGSRYARTLRSEAQV